VCGNFTWEKYGLEDVFEEFLKGMNHFFQCKFFDSLKSFEICAKSHYPPAFVMLGCLYKDGGLIGPKDDEKKEYWFSLSQKHSQYFKQNTISHPILLISLGRYFYWVEKDFKEAARCYQLSADQGNAFAQFNIAWCYQNGEGVPKDISKAIQYYQKSSDQGNAYAQYILAWCYQYGEGVLKDKSKSIQLFQKSADQGHSLAQFNLAWCYQNGEGVEKDISKANQLFQKAADQGHQKSKEWLSKYNK